MKMHLPRRTFLRGLGTAMALPLLDSMMPSRALAAATAAARRAPTRMAFVYVPNGAIMADWTPSDTGTNFKLPATLQPLEEVKSDLLVLTGLTQDKARPNGDGAGDHARASATFLTGRQARKTSGADIRVGISIDQEAAQRLGRATRLPSLELGLDRARSSGSCDSGYSCAYSFNIAWKGEATPLPPEVNPRAVFERLFSNGIAGETTEARARRQRQERSILDFVMEDTSRLKANLGFTDRRKLDEYMTAVRELEQRIEQAEKFATAADPLLKRPEGIPTDYAEHARLMFDMMAVAFQTDSTRIGTLILAHDGSNRSYREIGVGDGHHELSHHGRSAAKMEKISKINRYHMEQFGYFLKKLKGIKEGEGTLLDNSMIVYGSGISDGDRHNHDDLPVLMAGRGAGTVTTGRHIRYPRNTPMSNLFLSMMDRAGAPLERFGDSTGKLGELS